MNVEYTPHPALKGLRATALI